MKAKRPGLLEIVETCYGVEADTELWMRQVGEVVDAHLGYGLGTITIRYRIGDDFSFQPLAMLPVNVPADALAVFQRAHARLPPTYIQQTYASLPTDMACSTRDAAVRELTRRVFREELEPHGWYDFHAVNGVDPTRLGLALGAIMPRRGKMTAELRARWSRIAAHMAAAHRLRSKLSASELQRADGADAVLTPTGRVEHASDDAKDKAARETLVEGARVIDRARGKLRRSDPDLALSEWRALLAARWTLVDHFESDGKRYVLARRNAPVPRGLDALTERERQALGFARLGHSNKLIAYEMGIAASTVAVLLYRAAKKIGCERDQLIAAYTRIIGGD